MNPLLMKNSAIQETASLGNLVTEKMLNKWKKAISMKGLDQWSALMTRDREVAGSKPIAMSSLISQEPYFT